jgi:hypothetical protein
LQQHRDDRTGAAPGPKDEGGSGVLRPVMRPFSNTSRFTAPARWADSSTVSQMAKAASLCGIVTLTPANPQRTKPLIAAGKSPGAIGSGT